MKEDHVDHITRLWMSHSPVYVWKKVPQPAWWWKIGAMIFGKRRHDGQEIEGSWWEWYWVVWRGRCWLYKEKIKR